MNNDKLNKLKVFLSLAYPKGSSFEKADLNMLDKCLCGNPRLAGNLLPYRCSCEGRIFG